MSGDIQTNTYVDELRHRLEGRSYAAMDSSQFSLFCYKREPSNVKQILRVFAGKIVAGQEQTRASLSMHAGCARKATLEIASREFKAGLPYSLGKPDLVIMPVLVSAEGFSPEVIGAAQNHRNPDWYIHELSALVQVSQSGRIEAWRRAQAFQSWQLGTYRSLGAELDEILNPDVLHRPAPLRGDPARLNFWWNLGYGRSRALTTHHEA